MGKRVHYVRAVSETEEHQLRTLANSRTQPHRFVQRAQLIVNMLDEQPTDGLQSRHTGWIQNRGFRSAMGFSDSTKKELKDSPINPGAAHRKTAFDRGSQ